MRFLIYLPLMLSVATIAPQGCNETIEKTDETEETVEEAPQAPDPIGVPDDPQLGTGLAPPELIAWVVMAIDPVQCNGNPWEMDYLSKNEDAYTELRQNELEIIKAYYAGKGFPINKVTSEKTMDAVCEACTCPRGDTVYIEVPEGEADRMATMGFRIKGTKKQPNGEERE